jgi:flagellin-like protein
MVIMSKQGISPLIATVLVIGFTIILAALAITWGTGLFEDIQSDADTQAQLTKCTTLMTGVTLKGATTNELAADKGKDYWVIIDNNNAQGLALQNISLRIYYGDEGEVSSCTAVPSTVAAGVAKKVTCGAPEELLNAGIVGTELGAYASIQVGETEDGEAIIARCPGEIGRSKV